LIRRWLADLIDAYALDLAIGLADWLRGERLDVIQREPEGVGLTEDPAKETRYVHCARCGQPCQITAYGSATHTSTMRFVCPVHQGHTVQFAEPRSDQELAEWLTVFRPHGVVS
jgi:hypothetical protein